MTEFEREPQEAYVAWIAREARRPVALSPDLRARIVREVRALPRPVRPRRSLSWITAPRPVTRAPLTSALLAAGLVGIGVLGTLTLTHRDGRQTAGQQATAAATSQLPASNRVVVHEFVLHAPAASHVSLVGDFNGWNAVAAPMTRTADGTWMVQVKLPPGLHRYSFEVDGTNGATFVADPKAIRAPDDGFGPSSLLLVGQGAST
jgi:hypothetical protein